MGKDRKRSRAVQFAKSFTGKETNYSKGILFFIELIRDNYFLFMIQNKKLKSENLNFKVTSISMLPDEKCKEDYGNKYRKGSSFCAGNGFF